MFYEEKIIDGVIHYRKKPDGKWIKMNQKLLSKKVLELKLEIEDINFKKEQFKKSILNFCMVLIPSLKEREELWNRLSGF